MINDTKIHPAPGYILAEQIKAVASPGGIILPSEPGRRDEDHDRVVVLEDNRFGKDPENDEGHSAYNLAPGTRILVLGGKGMDSLVPGRTLLFIKAEELMAYFDLAPVLNISDN
jgi:co-chaperonin GroES (HSP10)